MGKSVPIEAGKTSRRMKLLAAAIAVGGLALLVFAFAQTRDYRLGQELVSANPDEIPLDQRLVGYANEVGRSAFNSNCASCHGTDMKGSQARGVPNLTDDIWLYDFGRVSDIERTVLYGIRSGLGKSHNVTDMPAIGRQKALTPAEIKDVIAYTLSLSKQRVKCSRSHGCLLFFSQNMEKYFYGHCLSLRSIHSQDLHGGTTLTRVFIL